MTLLLFCMAGAIHVCGRVVFEAVGMWLGVGESMLLFMFVR
jgi:hypothetical protein